MKARAVLVAAALAAAPIAAGAQPPTRARELSDQGRRLHDAGDYDRAIAAFRQAYELAPSPALLFNLGQSYRLKGACDDAVIMYRSYLKSEPPAEARRLAETHLASVEQCMQRRDTLRPIMATDTVAGAPGVAGVTTRAEGSGGKGLRRGGVMLAIGGGVLVGVGAYYALDAHDAAQDIEDAYQRGGRWREIEEIDARGRRSSTLATVFAIGGGAAAVGGAVMYIMGTRAKQERPAMTIAPRPGGAAVRLGWSF